MLAGRMGRPENKATLGREALRELSAFTRDFRCEKQVSPPDGLLGADHFVVCMYFVP